MSHIDKETELLPSSAGSSAGPARSGHDEEEEEKEKKLGGSSVHTNIISAPITNWPIRVEDKMIGGVKVTAAGAAVEPGEGSLLPHPESTAG